MYLIVISSIPLPPSSKLLAEIVNLSLFKFKKIDQFDFNQPELLFTENGSFIFFNGKGTIFNINDDLKEIIQVKDKTYSPLAFYFLMDKGLIQKKDEINKYFDIIINEINLDKEIKNLTIFKKALYNSDFANENELLEILNPVIKSESVWKPHSLYLMAEYYFSKNQKQKSKEFFEQIISLDKSNSKIKIQAQKRLRADFSE